MSSERHRKTRRDLLCNITGTVSMTLNAVRYRSWCTCLLCQMCGSDRFAGLPGVVGCLPSETTARLFGVVAQIAQAFENVKLALEEAGASIEQGVADGHRRRHEAPLHSPL